MKTVEEYNQVIARGQSQDDCLQVIPLLATTVIPTLTLHASYSEPISIASVKYSRFVLRYSYNAVSVNWTGLDWAACKDPLSVV